MLRVLRGRERRGVSEQATRIRQGLGIEEQLVERVAEVVVRVDVALAAGARVRCAAVADERRQLGEPGDRRFEPARRRADDERAQRRDEVVARPLTGDERFSRAHLAAHQHAQEHAVVVDRRARDDRATAELEPLSRRQHELEPRPTPRRSQPAQRRPAQHLTGRWNQPRQGNDQWMCELGHPWSRYPGTGDARAYEPRLGSADGPRAGGDTARLQAAASAPASE